MTGEDKWNDDATWDCVADGPLSPGQLAELVAACDRRPELWKRCALALLEEQAMRHELQSLTREHMGSGCSTASPTVSAALPCPAPAKLCDDSAAKTWTIAAEAAGATPRALFWNNIALAASLMIAFGIGWQLSARFGFAGRGDRSSDSSSIANDPSSSLADSNSSSVNSRPALPLVNDTMLASSGEVDPAVIDQVNAETLATALQGAYAKDDLATEYEQLRQRGYEVESQEGLIPVWLYDGRPTVVPYQQIKVRPKSASRAY